MLETHLRAAIAVLVVVVVMCSLPAAGDDLYEYGSSAELKGVSKYYIDAADDLDLRNILAERLAASGVTIVERPEDAEHWVIFRWSGSFWTRTIVIKRVGARHRLLMTYRGVEADLDDLASDAGKAIAKRLREIHAAK
jgi:hypothetical protein